MKLNKHFKIVFVFLLISFLLVFIPSILADSCFTFKESELYCTNIPLEQAEQECSLFEDCNLEHFFSTNNCLDKNLFPECQKIFCKSSCKYDFSGKCSSGQIPSGKEAEWCSSGCCQFNYLNKNYCDYKMSKWLCEVEAKNHNVFDFTFDPQILQGECLNLCLSKEDDVSSSNLNIKSQNQNNKNNQNNPPEMLVDVTSFLGGGNQNQETIKEKSNTEENLFVPFLILFIILLIVLYYFYKKNYFNNFQFWRRKDKGYNPGKNEFMISNKHLSKLISLFSIPFSKSNKEIKSMKNEHHLKLKEIKRHEYLDNFGKSIPKHQSSSFDLLNHIVKSHQSKEIEQMVKRIPKTNPKKDKIKIALNRSRNKKHSSTENPIDKLRKMFKK